MRPKLTNEQKSHDIRPSITLFYANEILPFPNEKALHMNIYVTVLQGYVCYPFGL